MKNFAFKQEEILQACARLFLNTQEFCYVGSIFAVASIIMIIAPVYILLFLLYSVKEKIEKGIKP